MKPRHIVFANGIVGAPKIPRRAGLENFRGTLMHTHDYKSGAQWKGRNSLVLGTGTSGHDIAQDLYGHQCTRRSPYGVRARAGRRRRCRYHSCPDLRCTLCGWAGGAQADEELDFERGPV